MKHMHNRVNVKKFFSYAVGFPCRCGASKPCRPGFSTRSSQLDRVAKRGMLTHLVALATAEFNGRAPFGAVSRFHKGAGPPADVTSYIFGVINGTFQHAGATIGWTFLQSVAMRAH